jgi:hypothetical protein
METQTYEKKLEYHRDYYKKRMMARTMRKKLETSLTLAKKKQAENFSERRARHIAELENMLATGGSLLDVKLAPAC